MYISYFEELIRSLSQLNCLHKSMWSKHFTSLMSQVTFTKLRSKRHFLALIEPAHSLYTFYKLTHGVVTLYSFICNKSLFQYLA